MRVDPRNGFFSSRSSWKLVGVAAAAAVRTDDGQQRDGDPGGVSLDMNYDAFAAHSKARNLDRCLGEAQLRPQTRYGNWRKVRLCFGVWFRVQDGYRGGGEKKQ